MISGYVMMELIQGCKNKIEMGKVQRELAAYRVIWPAPNYCDDALTVFTKHHLSHGAGLLDTLIGYTAISLTIPLYTFNKKHYRFIPELQAIQPYER